MNDMNSVIRKIRLKYLIPESILLLLIIGTIICYGWCHSILQFVIVVVIQLVLFGILLYLVARCDGKIKQIVQKSLNDEKNQKEYETLSHKIYDLCVSNGITNINNCNDSDLLLIAKQYGLTDISLVRRLFENGHELYIQKTNKEYIKQAEKYYNSAKFQSRFIGKNKYQNVKHSDNDDLLEWCKTFSFGDAFQENQNIQKLENVIADEDIKYFNMLNISVDKIKITSLHTMTINVSTGLNSTVTILGKPALVDGSFYLHVCENGKRIASTIICGPVGSNLSSTGTGFKYAIIEAYCKTLDGEIFSDKKEYTYEFENIHTWAIQKW